MRRFEAEYELAARVRHDDVIRVHESGIEEGHHYFVMDLEDPRTAADLHPGTDVDANATFYRLVAKRFAAAARALRAVHAEGIVHRDVKPRNLLLAQDRLVVCDFGSALDREHRSPDLEACLWGTVRYMSPDQFRADADPCDPRIDVYGLGLSLFEVVTGECPVPQGDEDEIVRWKLSRKLPLARRVNSDVPLRLERLIRRATASDPDDRHEHIGELAEDLDKLAQSRRL